MNPTEKGCARGSKRLIAEEHIAAGRAGKAVAAVASEITDKMEFLSRGHKLSNRIRYLGAQLKEYENYSGGGRRPGRGSGYRTNAGFTRLIDAKVSAEQDLSRAKDDYARWYVSADLAIDGVPDGRARTALKLHYLDGLDREVVAEQMGCKVGTVNRLLKDGCEMLRLVA